MALRKKGDYLSLREVAKLRGCNSETVRRAVKAGRLPSTQTPYGAGWAYVVERADAKAWSPGSAGRPKGSGNGPSPDRRKRVVQVSVNDVEAATLQRLRRDGESLAGACRRVLLDAAT